MGEMFAFLPSWNLEQMTGDSGRDKVTLLPAPQLPFLWLCWPLAGTGFWSAEVSILVSQGQTHSPDHSALIRVQSSKSPWLSKTFSKSFLCPSWPQTKANLEQEMISAPDLTLQPFIPLTMSTTEMFPSPCPLLS